MIGYYMIMAYLTGHDNTENTFSYIGVHSLLPSQLHKMWLLTAATTTR